MENMGSNISHILLAFAKSPTHTLDCQATGLCHFSNLLWQLLRLVPRGGLGWLVLSLKLAKVGFLVVLYVLFIMESILITFTWRFMSHQQECNDGLQSRPCPSTSWTQLRLTFACDLSSRLAAAMQLGLKLRALRHSISSHALLTPKAVSCSWKVETQKNFSLFLRFSLSHTHQSDINQF